MAILNNSNAISSAGGYDINNSLRFRSSASAYLSRTATTPTNNLKWTWSGWVKRGALNTLQGIFDGYSNGSNWTTLFFNSDNTLYFYNVVSGVDYDFTTTAVFRDPSAWYHIVLVYDSANATAANRVIIYVNNVSQSGSSPSGQTPQNQTAYINAANAQTLGRRTDGSYYSDCYMTEVNFIDGQALTPSSFGETDTTTGSWVAKKYTGTYGTNGFYLKFSDIATTSGSNAGLGKDFSGNSNYWTTNNISVTSGTTYDAMTDSPTNTSATVANYCTLNPLQKPYGSVTFSEANLKAVPASAWNLMLGTILLPSSGKYYWEVLPQGAEIFIGLYRTDQNSAAVNPQEHTGGTLFYYGLDGNKAVNDPYPFVAYGATYTTGDVIGVAVNMDSNEVTFYKNNSSQGAISFPSNMLSAPIAPAFVSYDKNIYVNFGQRAFNYTPPTGFNRLNTYNLPDSTIKKGNSYMDATLWTGNGGASVSVVNQAQFKPDFVWVKQRNIAQQHTLIDSVRGAGYILASDTTSADYTATTYGQVTSFNSNGFTGSLGSNGTYSFFNINSGTYVGWQWQAGQGSTSSNTSGSITTTTSVNTTAGFSVFTFTGTGASASVGHGLGVAPKFMIFKRRDSTSNWNVLTNATGSNQYGFLDLTTAFASAGETWTSTVINIGGNFANGATYVCYAFAEIAGYSKFGNYTGNGSADGPFVYTGFRPKFIMTKRASTAGSWHIYDSVRKTYNIDDVYLIPDNSLSEYSGDNGIDFLSNGFKLRSTNTGTNENGTTIIYAAFAENPFKNANAR